MRSDGRNMKIVKENGCEFSIKKVCNYETLKAYVSQLPKPDNPKPVIVVSNDNEMTGLWSEVDDNGKCPHEMFDTAWVKWSFDENTGVPLEVIGYLQQYDDRCLSTVDESIVYTKYKWNEVRDRIKGHSFDVRAIKEFIGDYHILIHNSAHDLPFLQRSFPELKIDTTRVLDTMTDIKWKQIAGYGSCAQAFLLYQHGWDAGGGLAHTAISDAVGVLANMSADMTKTHDINGAPTTYMKYIWDNRYKERFVFMTHSPYDDRMKFSASVIGANGGRFSYADKTWDFTGTRQQFTEILTGEHLAIDFIKKCITYRLGTIDVPHYIHYKTANDPNAKRLPVTEKALTHLLEVII